MFTQPQAWFGTTLSRSPSCGRVAERRDVDVAVLLVQRVQLRVEVAEHRAVAAVGVAVGGERLRAGVDHDLVGHRVGDDGDLDRDRAVRVVGAPSSGRAARTCRRAAR